MLRSLLICFLVLSSFLPLNSMADCVLKQCPFHVSLNDLEPLRHNKYITRYTIHHINPKKVTVDGQLSDGNALEIVLEAGDAWSLLHRKRMKKETQKSMRDTVYWLNEADQFAKLVWKKEQYLQLHDDLAAKKFIENKASAKKHIIYFEQYNEGNVKSIKVYQANHQTIIELQQSAC